MYEKALKIVKDLMAKVDYPNPNSLEQIRNELDQTIEMFSAFSYIATA